MEAGGAGQGARATSWVVGDWGVHGGKESGDACSLPPGSSPPPSCSRPAVERCGTEGCKEQSFLDAEGTRTLGGRGPAQPRMGEQQDESRRWVEDRSEQVDRQLGMGRGSNSKRGVGSLPSPFFLVTRYDIFFLILFLGFRPWKGGLHYLVAKMSRPQRGDINWGYIM